MSMFQRYSIFVFFIFFLNINTLVKSKNFFNISRILNIENRDFSILRLLPKLISFETLEDEIKINSDFIVPLIKVPTKRMYDPVNLFSKGLVNINIAALSVSGVIAIGGALIGSLFSLIGRTMLEAYKQDMYQESESNDQIKFSYKNSKGIQTEARFLDLIDNLEDFFRFHDIDASSCVQKAICALVKKSSKNNALGGKADTASKLIDGITSSSVILNLISRTAIKDAIDLGRSNRSCANYYKSCKWKESLVNDFIFSYINAL